MLGTKRIGSKCKPKRQNTKRSFRGGKRGKKVVKKTARRGRRGAKQTRSTRRHRRRHQRGGVSASQAHADYHASGSFTSDLSSAADDVAEVLDFKRIGPVPHHPAKHNSSQPKKIPQK